MEKIIVWLIVKKVYNYKAWYFDPGGIIILGIMPKIKISFVTVDIHSNIVSYIVSNNHWEKICVLPEFYPASED